MSQLPAHLQAFQAPDIGAALSQNLGSAMPPHVSIEGGGFTLVDASNNEAKVQTFDQTLGVYLDAAIIDVNEHMSRMYYIKNWVPGDSSPPDCWSDNGVAASIGASSVPLLSPPHPRAGQPAATCAECPMAVWGSKISNLGSKIPACSQKQKVALLVPGYQTLFLLAIPPNSHKFLREYVEKCRGSGINMADVITRISFVPGVQGTLQFSGISYIDVPTAQLRQAAYAEKKTDALVGRNDVPRQSGAAFSIPVTHTAPAVDQAFIQPQIAINGPYASPAPAQQVQQPGPFVPSTAAVAPPNGQFPQNPVSKPAPAGRRRRRTAAEMAANDAGAPTGAPAQPPAGGQPAPAAAPQAPFPHPGQAQQPTQLDAFPQPATPKPFGEGGFGVAAGTPVGADPAVAAQLDAFFKGA